MDAYPFCSRLYPLDVKVAPAVTVTLERVAAKVLCSTGKEGTGGGFLCFECHG